MVKNPYLKVVHQNIQNPGRNRLMVQVKQKQYMNQMVVYYSCQIQILKAAYFLPVLPKKGKNSG
jgi:hypothetical protein